MYKERLYAVSDITLRGWGIQSTFAGRDNPQRSTRQCCTLPEPSTLCYSQGAGHTDHAVPYLARAVVHVLLLLSRPLDVHLADIKLLSLLCGDRGDSSLDP